MVAGRPSAVPAGQGPSTQPSRGHPGPSSPVGWALGGRGTVTASAGAPSRQALSKCRSLRPRTQHNPTTGSNASARPARLCCSDATLQQRGSIRRRLRLEREGLAQPPCSPQGAAACFQAGPLSPSSHPSGCKCQMEISCGAGSTAAGPGCSGPPSGMERAVRLLPVASRAGRGERGARGAQQRETPWRFGGQAPAPRGLRTARPSLPRVAAHREPFGEAGLQRVTPGLSSVSRPCVGCDLMTLGLLVRQNQGRPQISVVFESAFQKAKGR